MVDADMEKFVQVAPHSLALVLSQHCAGDGEYLPRLTSPTPSASACLSASDDSQHHSSGYEVFANFKAINMQHFWNKALTQALGHIFFLGWIDERVLLIQGKEVHLQVLRNGWTRRTLRPPQGFDISNIGKLICGSTLILNVVVLPKYCLGGTTFQYFYKIIGKSLGYLLFKKVHKH